MWYCDFKKKTPTKFYTSIFVDCLRYIPEVKIKVSGADVKIATGTQIIIFIRRQLCVTTC